MGLPPVPPPIDRPGLRPAAGADDDDRPGLAVDAAVATRPGLRRAGLVVAAAALDAGVACREVRLDRGVDGAAGWIAFEPAAIQVARPPADVAFEFGVDLGDERAADAVLLLVA